MKWQQETYCNVSDKGYKVAAFFIDGNFIYRAFKPEVKGSLPEAIGSTYKKSSLAKRACEQDDNKH